MARKSVRIELNQEERKEIERKIRSHKIEKRYLMRMEVVLKALDGLTNKEISEKIGMSQMKVGKWRNRFAKYGIEGLQDASRSGRPLVYGHDVRLKILNKACEMPDMETHWSVRELEKELKELGIRKSQIHRVLNELDLKPHQFKYWLNSKDPDFERKEIEIVGLYLNPPENAIIVSVDEKTGIQALGRKYPNKVMRPGNVEKIEFEYKRHGTWSLFVALWVHSGKVKGLVEKRHTNGEFIKFLDKIVKEVPWNKELHIIVDNLSTHKHKNVKEWQDAHPNVVFHFTPTHASWLNQVEIWFSIMTRKILKRGVFASKEALKQKLLEYIEYYNKKAKPFAWTYAGKPCKI